MADTNGFSDRVRAARQAAGLGQSEAAQALGMHFQTLSKVERGAQKSVRGDVLTRMAELFGVAERWLATGEGPREREDASPQSLRDAERPASQDWGWGALFAVEEMAVTLARITRTARIRMGEAPDQLPDVAPLVATPAAAGARPAPPAAEAQEAQRVRELERQLRLAAEREEGLRAELARAIRARQTATGAADAPAPPARRRRRA